MIWWILHSSPPWFIILKMWSMWKPLLYNMVMPFVSWLHMTCPRLQRILFNMHNLLTELTAQGIRNILPEKWSVNSYHWNHIFIRLCFLQVMRRITLNLFAFHWAGTTPDSWYWFCIFDHSQCIHTYLHVVHLKDNRYLIYWKIIFIPGSH